MASSSFGNSPPSIGNTPAYTYSVSARDGLDGQTHHGFHRLKPGQWLYQGIRMAHGITDEGWTSAVAQKPNDPD